jgi:serine/threonine protein kinase
VSIFYCRCNASGTYLYAAPEVVDEHTKASVVADTWSFGCVLYEMCTHTAPYYNNNVIAIKNLSSPNGEPPGDISKVKNERIAEIIGKCWTRDPNQRPRMSIIYHQLRTLFGIQPCSYLIYLR